MSNTIVNKVADNIRILSLSMVENAKSENIDINVMEEGKKWEMPRQILLVFIGCIVIYGCLFSIGSFIYNNILS